MAEECAPTLRVHSRSEERRGSGAQLFCRWRERNYKLWSYKWDEMRFGQSDDIYLNAIWRSSR